MIIPECGVRLMVADLAIIRKHVRKLVRVSRELAALRKLEQMQSVRRLEQRATWMREKKVSTGSRSYLISQKKPSGARVKTLIRNLLILKCTTLDGRLSPNNLLWT